MDDSGTLGERRQRFGDVLRRFRLDRRISQRELAERAGISLEAVSTLERSFRRIPRGQTLAALVSALELNGEDAAEFDRAASEPPRPRRRQEKAVGGPVEGRLQPTWKPLLGRQSDSAALRLLMTTSRLVTVVGAGGIGKTAIARAMALEYEAGVDDPVYFLELASVVDGAGLATALAKMLAAPITSDDRQVEVLIQSLASRELLVVLDNCEHLIQDVSDVVEGILTRCVNVRILTTSRSALGIATEAVYFLPTLATPRGDLACIKAVDAAAADAVRLFVIRAKEINANFALTDANAPIISEICCRLDGIALAIELAARRTLALTLHDILERLNHRFKLLTGGSARIARHETLRALFDWSYDLLNGDDREFFDSLGVFPNTFSLEAAHAIAARHGEDEYGTLDRLESLVAQSLLVRIDCEVGTVRYTFLQTLREFALERLSESRRRDDLRRRFLRYFHELYVTAGTAFQNDPRHEILADLSVENDNRSNALSIALEIADYVRGAELMLALEWPDGKEDESAAMTGKFALALGSEPKPLLARLWTRHAYDIYYRSQAAASVAKERAIAFARESDDDSVLANALQMVASVEMRSGNLAPAARSLQESAELKQSTEVAFRQQKMQALLATYSGHFDSAVDQFRELARIHRRRGSVEYEVESLLNLAEAEYAAGSAVRAVATYRSLEPLLSAITDNQQAQIYANAAGYFVAVDDLDGTREMARRSVMADRGGIYSAFALEHMALAEALDGRFARAATIAGFAYSLMERYNDSGHFTELTTRERLQTKLSVMGHAERTVAEENGARLTIRDAISYIQNHLTLA